jgi:ABC-2 type transport system ATP-binding protein
MADVAALCPRVMVIDRGRLHYDGGLAGLVRRFSTHKTVTVTGELAADLSGYGDVVERKPGRASIRVAPDQVSPTAARLLSDFTITDLTIEDPPLEEVIEQVFASVEEQTE